MQNLPVALWGADPPIPPKPLLSPALRTHCLDAAVAVLIGPPFSKLFALNVDDMNGLAGILGIATYFFVLKIMRGYHLPLDFLSRAEARSVKIFIILSAYFGPLLVHFSFVPLPTFSLVCQKTFECSIFSLARLFIEGP
jgi:hypothetical protein